jgi:hypothetical protein
MAADVIDGAPLGGVHPVLDPGEGHGGELALNRRPTLPPFSLGGSDGQHRVTRLRPTVDDAGCASSVWKVTAILRSELKSCAQRSWPRRVRIAVCMPVRTLSSLRVSVTEIELPARANVLAPQQAIGRHCFLGAKPFIQLIVCRHPLKWGRRNLKSEHRSLLTCPVVSVDR